MDQTRHDALTACLADVFGEGHDDLMAEALPLLVWVELNGGQTLVREADAADAVYVVVSGRLRASEVHGDRRVVIDEVVRGGIIGAASVLMSEAHRATVLAVRDSVLARMSATAFATLWQRHPVFSERMARLAIGRVRSVADRPRNPRPATVCLVPISDGFDLPAFGSALADAMGQWGPVRLETRETIEAQFGAGAANARPADERYHQLSTWLDETERDHASTIFLADDGESEWTRRCIRHADQVLFVARADAAMRIHPIEERLCMGDRAITAARQSLVLLHPAWRHHPTGTAAWLDRRPMDAHHHVRPERPQDVARLARVLTGNAVGLVLSGGGARGFAHLGVYRALEEAGIEVDIVGGTSIGAVMAAFFSFDLPAARAIELARQAFANNPTGDFNILPLVSLIRGRRMKKAFDRGVRAATGADADVLDSWRTLYCVATSYSAAREVVITRGPLSRALRASVSIPVALPPVASDGELLVDGGIFNNFPVDVMARMGVRQVIGVDLARPGSHSVDFEEVPGPWSLLRDRLRAADKRRYNVPSLGTILVGTTLLYSASRREEARASVDLYINPDVSGIGVLEMSAFDRAVDVGYREARLVLGSTGASNDSRNSGSNAISAAVAASSR
jgi:NTE family protein